MSEIKRLICAFSYSLDGLKRAYQDEAAFRLEARLSIILIPLGLILGDTTLERALLVASWLLVPMTELLNSGLEAITDYATDKERHDLAKKAKDAGSASVLIAAVICGIIWIGCLL